jgi:hypothetical protein
MCEVTLTTADPYVLRIDISKPFETNDIPIISQLKKNTTIPVANCGLVTADAARDAVYISHGDFYDKPPYQDSEYYLEKDGIPGNEVWRFNLNATGMQVWENVTFLEEGEGMFARRYGCAMLSEMDYAKGYCFGCVLCGGDWQTWGLSNGKQRSAYTPDEQRFEGECLRTTTGNAGV